MLSLIPVHIGSIRARVGYIALVKSNPIGFFTNAQKCQYWHFRLYCIKKNPVKNVTPVGIERKSLIASNSKTNTILSTLT